MKFSSPSHRDDYRVDEMIPQFSLSIPDVKRAINQDFLTGSIDGPELNKMFIARAEVVALCLIQNDPIKHVQSIQFYC